MAQNVDRASINKKSSEVSNANFNITNEEIMDLKRMLLWYNRSKLKHPLSVLRYLRSSTTNLPDDVAKHIWLSSLSTHVTARVQELAKDARDLNHLAELANEIFLTLEAESKRSTTTQKPKEQTLPKKVSVNKAHAQEIYVENPQSCTNAPNETSVYSQNAVPSTSTWGIVNAPRKSANEDISVENICNFDPEILELKERLQHFNIKQRKEPEQVLQHLHNVLANQQSSIRNRPFTPLNDNCIKEIWLSSLSTQVSTKVQELAKDARDLNHLAELANDIFLTLEMESKRSTTTQKSKEQTLPKNVSDNKAHAQEIYVENPKSCTNIQNENSIDSQNAVPSTSTSGIVNAPKKSANEDIGVENMSDFFPNILELKQILQQFNKNHLKQPSHVLHHLHNVLRNIQTSMKNCPFTPLNDTSINEIWLSSLAPEVSRRIKSLGLDNRSDRKKLMKVANKVLAENTRKTKSKIESLNSNSKVGYKETKIVQTLDNRFPKFAFQWNITDAVNLPLNHIPIPKNVKPRKTKPKRATFHKKNEKLRLDNLLANFNQSRNRKPTEMLKFLRQDTGTRFGDSTLKLIWLSHLPDKIKSFLSTESNTLDKLAIEADVIYTKSRYIAPQSQLKTNTTEELLRKMKLLLSTVDVLTAKLEALNVNVVDIKSDLNHIKNESALQMFKRSSTVNLNRRNVYRGNAKFDLCYYHRTFGTASKKCDLPCYYYIFCAERKRPKKYRPKQKIKIKYIITKKRKFFTKNNRHRQTRVFSKIPQHIVNNKIPQVIVNDKTTQDIVIDDI